MVVVVDVLDGNTVRSPCAIEAKHAFYNALSMELSWLFVCRIQLHRRMETHGKGK